METPLVEYQKAVYDSLTAEGLKVYDYRPEDKPFPYVVIGEDMINSSHTKDKPHFTVISTFHIFTNNTGSIQSKMVMDTIISNINRLLPVQNWKITHNEVLLTTYFEDTLPDCIHGVVQLELQIIKL